MNAKQIFVIAIIAMFLIVPFASAKQESVDVVKDAKQDKKIEEKAVDKTKEQPKEVKNKDKDIKGKITVTDTENSKYSVKKKSYIEIAISKQESKGNHTKSKIAIPQSESSKIDIDGDGKFGVLRIGDNGEILDSYVVTSAQLEAGVEMTFSTNIVNGYSGHKTYSFSNVQSGQTLNIDDMSGSNYTVVVAVDGVVPTYTVGIPTRGLLSHYTFDSDSMDKYGTNNGSAYNITYSNGGAVFRGNLAWVNLGNNFNVDQHTIAYKMKVNKLPTSTDMYVFKKGTTFAEYISPSTKELFVFNANFSDTYINSGNFLKANKVYDIFSEYNRTAYSFYNNQTLTRSQAENAKMGTTTSSFIVGRNGDTSNGYFNGTLYDLAIYNVPLNTSERATYYAGGSGISFQPEPSYNFTGYNVASGVEKVIDTDNTCTGLKYVATTGGTHNVTVTVYFTEDTTLISDSKTDTHQNVSIVHTKQNATASVGTIAYELDPLYSGTPTLSSNNTNATISRNNTHVIISTGLIKQGQSFSYAVSVPDNHDHIIFLNKLMKWMGTGWDYVGVAPEDWTDAITDIEVTVS